MRRSSLRWLTSLAAMMAFSSLAQAQAPALAAAGPHVPVLSYFMALFCSAAILAILYIPASKRPST